MGQNFDNAKISKNSNTTHTQHLLPNWEYAITSQKLSLESNVYSMKTDLHSLKVFIIHACV